MAGRPIQTDRFGNAYQLVGCKPNKNGFSVGYAELGGKLYKIEPSEASKEGISHWVKITKVDKKAKQTSM